jgi:hypothetical protein
MFNIPSGDYGILWDLSYLVSFDIGYNIKFTYSKSFWHNGVVSTFLIITYSPTVYLAAVCFVESY